jgi:hypothetical protein
MTSTIRMVQHSPFMGKEDPNLHHQAFIQLCQSFNMDGMTQDQIRARLFPFSLLGKALQRFYTQLAKRVQNWDTLMRAFMKEYYTPVKLKSCAIRLLLLLNILRRLYRRHLTASISTLGRFHITSSRRRISFKSSIKDSPWRQGRSSMHRREDPSLSLRRLKLSLYSRRLRTMTHGCHLDAEDRSVRGPVDGREGPIRRTREGRSEWEPIKILLEGDGNSNKMNTASNTRLRLTTQVGQAHVATGVPLDLGTNTQHSDPRTQRNTKPRVSRPTPVRPVSTTGQTGPYW